MLRPVNGGRLLKESLSGACFTLESNSVLTVGSAELSLGFSESDPSDAVSFMKQICKFMPEGKRMCFFKTSHAC